MLFKIRNRKVADLKTLGRLVLKFIYEETTMSLAEIELMQRSIVAWPKKWMLTETEREFVNRAGWVLYRNDKGDFDQRKALFKDKGIDWRRFHRLPESYTRQDLMNAFKLEQSSNKREGIE